MAATTALVLRSPMTATVKPSSVTVSIQEVSLGSLTLPIDPSNGRRIGALAAVVALSCAFCRYIRTGRLGRDLLCGAWLLLGDQSLPTIGSEMPDQLRASLAVFHELPRMALLGQTC
jgi:hypothetical protein